MFDSIADENPRARRSHWKIYALSGALVLLVAFSAYLYHQVRELRREAARLQELIVAEISNFRETTVATSQANRRHLEGLRQELEAARQQASMAVGRAKREAQIHAERLARQLAESQRKQGEQMLGQLTDIRAETTAASVRIGEVSGDVDSVKTEVATTKSEMDKSVADLKRVTGDLGVLSGLIATNSRELAALKALGERSYYEFKLVKTKQPQKVGDIAVLLKKTDPKRHRYTVEVVADDKRIEKKDKGVNEPVQFYVFRARQPYELVVNEVAKDQIKGYLAAPKAHSLRELTELRR